MRLSAPAKLNRFLAVLGRREDGFHALELITTVLPHVETLADQLAGERADSFSLTLSGPHAEGLEANESNLVVKAWRALEKAAQKPLPAQLLLEKRIPHGGGLGGGSSDAAAALKLGNQLFHLGLSHTTLLTLGAQLGSDVPLFLLGGTVLGLDRGERVFPLQDIPLEPLLLVHPGLHVPTPAVYGALPKVGYPPATPCPSLPLGERPPWRNDLTDAALHVCPDLAHVRQALQAVGGEPLLCGSGACWAARFPTRASRDAAQETLAVHHKQWQVWSL